jgi:tetratricopeptide (TPR) repeat protein
VRRKPEPSLPTATLPPSGRACPLVFARPRGPSRFCWHNGGVKRGLLFAGVIALLGSVLWSSDNLLAQDPMDPVGGPGATPLGSELGQPQDFPRTAAEDEVWQLYQEEKLLTARRKVEALLEEDPDSIVGRYVFAQILRRAEGNLPKAMKQMGKARELYEQRYKPTVVNLQETPWLLHREILYAAQIIAGELERHEYQLQLLDYHDSLYDPRLTAEHAWPLMLLGRFDEARQYAEKAAQSSDEFQRSLGRNALCAIEGEAGNREERFEACLSAYDDAAERARGDDPFAKPDEITSVTVHAYNAAQAALSVLRPDEAERLAKAGAVRLEFTPANPWRFLVRLYTDQGRMDEAVLALREMQSWRRKMPPHLREQERAETDVAFATVLLVAGETETGMEVIDRALANPDRRGLTSSSKEQALGAHALMRLAMRRTHAEVEAERATWSGTAESARITRAQLERSVQDWADAERIRGVLASGEGDELLVASLRMYVAGGLEPVPSWLVGDLVPILGAGVSSVVLDMVREAEDDDALEPYYVALAAEIALHDGDETEALRLAEEALASLPEFEALLRARVAAVAGEAAWDLGKQQAALGFWATAMQRDAGIIRRRGIALPARIDNQASGPVADRVVELLEDSPRFELGHSNAFTITLDGSGRELKMCLLEPGGGDLGCAETPPEPEPGTQTGVPGVSSDEELEDDDYAAMTVEALHARAFAMPVGLSNIDLGSLDGTATISDEANRERMQNLLDKLKTESD